MTREEIIAIYQKRPSSRTCQANDRADDTPGLGSDVHHLLESKVAADFIRQANNFKGMAVENRRHAQATDRAYRIGQHNSVFVHKLQKEKGKLAAGILAVADVSSRLDAAMVRSLLDA